MGIKGYTHVYGYDEKYASFLFIFLLVVALAADSIIQVYTRRDYRD